ncbi:MAG: DUF4177 domain-containing protein [Deltaproteobacteria bacterium]|nr:DUF4177 domain-containing protein [Deltaproteobacteria bacterium]
MKTFEYEITRHSADEFNKLVYFCTETAECSLQEVPDDHTEKLGAILNERGRQGWELVQIAFGQDGIMVFWKRKIKKD